MADEVFRNLGALWVSRMCYWYMYRNSYLTSSGHTQRSQGFVVIRRRLFFDGTCVKLLQNRCNRTPLIICQHWYKWWLDVTGQQTITWTNVDSDLFRLTWSLGRDETTFPEIRWHSGNHASHGTVFHYIITHAPVQTTDLRGLDWTCAIHSLIFMSVLNFSTNGMAALLPVLLFSMTS